MRKQDIKQTAVVGQTQPINQPADLALPFQLMEAVPFLISGPQSLSFNYPDLATKLLRTYNRDLPQQVSDWEKHLSAQAQRDRSAAIRRLTWKGAQYRVQYAFKLDTGQTIWIEEAGERVNDSETKPAKIIGVFRNIDRPKAMLDQAAYVSQYDLLSGLLNESAFSDAVNHSCALIRRQGMPASLLRLRVTNLADINAVYGYDTGDKLIALIGERLAGLLRAPDYVARLFGPDFGVCVLGSDPKGAEEMLGRIKAPLADIPYNTPQGPLNLEFAIAITDLGVHASSADEGLAQTQRVLDGQSEDPWSVAFYSPDMVLSSGLTGGPTRDDEQTQEILAALNERRISLAYQPIIHAQTRDLHHYECLLRLRSEEGEVYSAGRVIMAAEKLGLVHLLDRRALELAAETLRTMPDVHLALNVSAATIREEAMVEEYLLALKALGKDAARVTLELTETAALDDPGLASYFSVESRKLGCSFAIDDFGSGYTTFQNLMAIEADAIKIDGTYIQGIATEPHKETFVRMMVDLAQTFDVKTVAEMVDDRADAEMLRRLGVDYLQGYMFGIPSAAPAWRRETG